MDFQSVNLLNVRINLISGNLFPITTDNTRFPIAWKIYSAVIWLIISVLIIAFISGFFMVSKTKAINDGMIGIVFTIEVFFMIVCIHTRRDLAVQLIQNMNNILRVQDETMKCIVMASLKSVHTPFKFYMSSIITTIIWIIMPLTAVFRNNSFIYEDYRLAFVISKQPFSAEIFLLGGLLSIFCSVYVVVKKIAVDIYMLNFVMLMTAQYRYVAVKLEKLFQKKSSQNKRDNSQKENYLETDSWAETEINAICQHYNIVVHMSSLLKKLLSANFYLIYISSILRFSFIGVMLSNITLLMTIIERTSMIFFAFGEIMQFYILCFNVQKLLDASTEMTDAAFHGNWYQFRSSIKRKFILMTLGNNLKCKLVALERFNVCLPLFMTVMTQAYSIAILCLKIIKR